jgi:hypothetical protein
VYLTYAHGLEGRSPPLSAILARDRAVRQAIAFSTFSQVGGWIILLLTAALLLFWSGRSE